MGPKGPRDKNKYPWPYVPNSPLKSVPMKPAPSSSSSPSSSARRRRSTRLKKKPSAPDRGTRDGPEQPTLNETDGQEPNIDGETLGEEEEEVGQDQALVAVPAKSVVAAEVVVPSDSEEEKTEPDINKIIAKQKRAQLHTFNIFFHELSADIQQQWLETEKEGYPNKRAKRREILNFVVPNSTDREINPDARTITKSIFCRKHQSDEQKQVGLTRTEMRAKLGDTLFQEGLDCGDIVENKEKQLFYMRSEEVRKEKGMTEESNAMLQYSCETTDFLGTAANFIDDHMVIDVDNGARSSGDPNPQPQDMVEQEQAVISDLLIKVQHSFDASTRLRNNVSQCGQELMRVAELTPDGVEMVRRGLALSKNLLEANTIDIYE